MPTIIDGYNLLRTCGFVNARVGPGTLERARGMLLGFLAQVFAPEERGDVTVVFDSALRVPDLPNYTVQNGIHIHYATGHHDADELIIEMLQRHSAPKSLMIVSSDHQIQRAAQRRRARFCDSDRWYEDTIQSNRSNPRVAATAAEIQLEIQLLRKDLAISTPDPEQEQLLAEFSKTISAFLPPPKPISEPEPPVVLDLAVKPSSTELRHGNWSDALVEEAVDLFDEDFFSAALGEKLNTKPIDIKAPRRIVESPPDSLAASLGPSQVSERATIDEPRTPAWIDPQGGSSVPTADSEVAAKQPVEKPRVSGISPTDIPADQLDRWNRQLKSTDLEIFPPGYGEDILFTESFEIDDRLKKKRRP